MVTIRDVARHAGVSTSTVSRALNGQSDVSEETRRAVLKAAQELGYVPSASGQALRGKSLRVIGIVTTARLGNMITGHSVYGPGVQALESRFAERQFHTILLPIGLAEPSFESSADSGQLARTPMIDLIEGFVFYYCWGSPDLYRYMRQNGKPFILVQRTEADERISTVRSYDEEGIRQGVYHLYELGRRRLAYISPRMTPGSPSTWRYEGFVRGCKELGIAPAHHIVYGEDEQQQLDELLRPAVKEMRIDGIVAFNDYGAFKAIGALRRMGLRVPEDISVIGYDDTILAADHEPPLTTFRISFDRMAEHTVRHLNALLQDPEAGPFHTVLQTELVVRRSCGTGSKHLHDEHVPVH